MAMNSVFSVGGAEIYPYCFSIHYAALIFVVECNLCVEVMICLETMLTHARLFALSLMLDSGIARTQFKPRNLLETQVQSYNLLLEN